MNKELETDAVKKMEAMEICLLLEEKAEVITIQEEFQSHTHTHTHTHKNTFSVSEGQDKMKGAYTKAREIPAGSNEDLWKHKGIKY